MSLFNLIAFVQVCVSAPDVLPSSLPKWGGLFGVAVAQRGDRIVVGAEGEFAQMGGGAVYVFELAAGSWVERARLEANAPPQGTFKLGRSVACDDSRIVAGAPGAYHNPGPNSGKVYVWQGSGSNWVEEAILHPVGQDNFYPVKEFGASVALSGDTLFVGAPGVWSSNNPTPGLAYVFRRVGPAWALEAILHASDSHPRNEFGRQVALEGDLAVVSAGNAPGQQPNAGAAYVFARNGSTWTQVQKLVASDGDTGDVFGGSLALQGDTLVVCASRRAEVFSDMGAAYVFERTGATWQERSILVPADSAYGIKLFGVSVALDGGTLLGGAPMQLAPPGGGWFHVYLNSTAGWQEHLKLSAPGAAGADQVGRSLSVQGDRLVVGAAQSGASGMTNAGAVFVFDLQASNPAPTFYCTAKQDSQGCTPILHHVGMPSVSSAVGSYNVLAHFLRSGTLGTFIYSKGGPSAAPFSGGTLCIAPPIQRTGGMTSGGTSPCSGSFNYDFQARIASGIDPGLVAGQDVWFQYWYRDHGAPPGQEVGLTSAIHVQICP